MSGQSDYLEWLRDGLHELIQQQDFEAAKMLLEPAQPADIAEAIEQLPAPMQVLAFRLLSKTEAIEVYEYFSPPMQRQLIGDFRQPEVLGVIDGMSPDNRAKLFDELPAKVVKQVLQELDPAERAATSRLLGYSPNTAGRIMTPEYVALRERQTVAQAFDHIRPRAKHAETIAYLYVMDDQRRLTGLLSLRELVIASPDRLIGDIMTRHVVYAHTDTDQEDVARLIQRYDFLALPIVDQEQRLVGIVTVDDVLDVLEAETTEDIYTLGGVQAVEEGYFQSNLFTVARKRVTWLMVLLVANTLTSSVIRSQEEVLEQVVVLAAFIPLLIDAGGNVGAQSSTVVIRGLNTDDRRMKDFFWVIRREVIAGTLLGVMLAIVVFVWATVLQGDAMVAIAVGVSLFAISILASFAGSALPYVFRALKLDPALMSVPFITTAVDVLGVLIYLNAARVILEIEG
ncbi:magnesium transporter [filamentous cyanobacterium CCT1]|nr:magnesium transporter [filamentous cyanobacterium CCT1]PSN81478.1 magnesium transporter [filamentous cyanobacterium CCP4]